MSQNRLPKFFYINQKFILPTFNDMKLVPFEGLAHGEKLICLRGTFIEVNCRPVRTNLVLTQ